MNSIVLYTEPCPQCRRNGNDKSGDNLAVYSDGHKYCFNCGYYVSGSSVYNARLRRNDNSNKQPVKITLPEDCDTFYTQRELEWIRQYALTKTDLLKYNALHSDKGIRINYKGELKKIKDVLIFPVFGNGLEGYVARTFDTPKVVSKGDMKNVFNILPGKLPLVLVEDIVSAIKVNKVGHATMPIYGSNIKNRFERLKMLGHKDLIIWLDPNMYSSMITQCRYAIGLNTHIIFSTKDPKEHTYEEIKDYLK